MRLILAVPVMIAAALLQAAPALAGDPLALGGALRPAGEARGQTLWESGGFAAGVSRSPGSATGGAMQLGGFLAWRSDDYHFDASLAPKAGGSLTAGFGAMAGAAPGQPGTSYSVRLGMDLGGDRFTVNPASGLGLADVVQSSQGVNATVTINHALTPSLSIVGTAEARRAVGSVNEGITNQNRFLFGAGLGYRF